MLDVLGDGWLGDVQLFGGFRVAALLDQREKSFMRYPARRLLNFAYTC
jgi:hypothetical protein